MTLHPGTRRIHFEHTADAGVGRSLFVVGDHPVLGSGNPAQGVKMRFTPGNVWQVDVAIEPAGAPVAYRFVARSTDPGSYCNPGNATTVADGFSLEAGAAGRPPHAGKTVYFRSEWPRVFLLHRGDASEDFQEVAMTRVGDGRTPGEFLHRIEGAGLAGREMEFVFHDGAGRWDNAFGQARRNYRTALDLLFVQDRHVFNYVPPPSVSAPRVESRFVDSTVAGIPGRDVRIRLPRGYDSQPDRRYPVLYLHDGQNVFCPGGSYGSWDADLIADVETQMGRMRETILVAIDNTGARQAEYLPPTDDFRGRGTGDGYARFVIDNVRAAIDGGYRTLGGRANSLLMGSSFGGLITAFMGWEHSDIFGRIAPMSPAWWAAPNLREQMRNMPARALQVYLDWGTRESSGSAPAEAWWEPFLDGYDIYLSQGHVVGDDFLPVIGCGHVHHESAWAGRLPGALRFLLDVRDEPNAL